MSQPTCSSSDTDNIDISSVRKEMTFIEHLTKVSQERKEQYTTKIQEYGAEYYFKFMSYILPVAIAYPEATNGLCEKQTTSYRFFYPVSSSKDIYVTFYDETGVEYLKIDVTRSVHDFVIDGIGKNEGLRSERAFLKLGEEDDSPTVEGIVIYVDIEGKTFSEGDEANTNPRGFILRTAETLRGQILENIEGVSEKMYLKVVGSVVPLMVSFPENYEGSVSQTDEKYTITLKLDNEVPVKLRFKRSDDEDDEKAFVISVNIAEEVHNRLNGRIGMLRGVMCKKETLEGGENSLVLTIMKN